MKNAMKKLTSLLLVAVLLVGALPFAASAAGIAVEIYQSVDGVDEVTKTTTDALSIAAICEANGIGAGEFDGAWVTNNGQEYTKKYDESFGDTSTLVKIRKTAKVTTATCDQCGVSYKIADGHTCAPAAPVSPITIVVKVDESSNVVWTGSKLPSNGEYALVQDLLTYCWNGSWDGAYDFSHAWSKTNNTKTTSADAKVYSGDEVHIMLKTKAAQEPTTEPTTKPTEPTNNNIVSSTKNQNDIFLNIFVNKDFNNCKTIKLNDHWTIADDKITTYEILNYVVTDYYKASNANLGLQCDGLYYSVGSFMYNWLLDNGAVKTDAVDNIAVKRANGTVTINVMVTNAAVKGSTAAADSSNPKTGDSIYTAMTVMGISAASLAAVMFFYNKKRMAL